MSLLGNKACFCLALVDPAQKFSQMVVPAYTPYSTRWKFQCSYIFKQHKYYTIDFVLFPTFFTEYYAFKVYICCCTLIPSNYCIIFSIMLPSIEFFFWLFGMVLVSAAGFCLPAQQPFPSSSILTTNCAHLHRQVLQPQPSEVTLRSSKQIRYFYFACDPLLAKETWREVCAGWNSGKHASSAKVSYLVFLQKHKEDVLFSYLDIGVRLW